MEQDERRGRGRGRGARRSGRRRARPRVAGSARPPVEARSVAPRPTRHMGAVHDREVARTLVRHAGVVTREELTCDGGRARTHVGSGARRQPHERLLSYELPNVKVKELRRASNINPYLYINRRGRGAAVDRAPFVDRATRDGGGNAGCRTIGRQFPFEECGSLGTPPKHVHHGAWAFASKLFLRLGGGPTHVPRGDEATAVQPYCGGARSPLRCLRGTRGARRAAASRAALRAAPRRTPRRRSRRRRRGRRRPSARRRPR